MNEARYASLSSGLLARKGAAKPAMRPQGFTPIEDLGWNDMGFAQQPVEEPFEVEVPEHVPSSITALTPAPRAVRADPDTLPIAAQQRAIAERFEAEEPEFSEVQPDEELARPQTKASAKAKVVALPKRTLVPAGKKVAFTLRLDGDRHLRLRLACAVAGRSAQQVVTTALDQFLNALPEVETLAQQVPGVARN